MKRFVTKLTIVTLVIAVIGWLVFHFFPEFSLPIFPFMLLFFYLVTIAIYAYQLKAAKKRVGVLTRTTMVITTLKLFFFSAIAVVYIIINKENTVPFVICLMVLYIIYTFVGVNEITKITRPK